MATGLPVVATDVDGVPEAVESPRDTWLIAVQWHPENLKGDSVSGGLFSEFARAAREGSRRADAAAS